MFVGTDNIVDRVSFLFKPRHNVASNSHSLRHVPSAPPFLLSFVSHGRSIRAQPPARSPQITPSSRAISECRNLRCRCTERRSRRSRASGWPPSAASDDSAERCERASERCYGTSPHGHRLGQVSDKARSHQVLRGLSVCVRSRASDGGLVSLPFVPVI